MTKFKLQNIALTAIVAVGAFLPCNETLQAQNKLITGTMQPHVVKNVTSENTAPNFAFPDKVAADADIQLSKALNEGNGQEVVEALVCSSLANNMISPSLLQKTMERIDSVIQVENNQPVKSLLYLLQANIYNGAYNSNRWNYDHRTIPVDSLPADYTEWSGEQFKLKINSLADSAIAPGKELLATPIEKWSKVINTNEYTSIFYPSLFDMVIYNVINIKTGLSNRFNPLPSRFIMPCHAFSPLPAEAHLPAESIDIHQLYLKWIEANNQNIPAMINAKLLAIGYVNSLTRGDSDNNISLNDAYLAIYNQYKQSEWSVEALTRCITVDTKEYATILKEAISKYPNYIQINNLKQQLASIQRPSVTVTANRFNAPGQELSLKINYNNTNAFTIKIAKKPLSSDVGRASIDELSKGQLYRMIPVKTTLKPMPFKADTIISVPLTDPGIYFVWSTLDASPADRSDLLQVTCSDIVPVALSIDSKLYPYAVDATTGRPIEGVKITGYSDRKTNKAKELGVSNNNGTVGKQPFYYKLVYKKDGQTIGYNPSMNYGIRKSDQPSLGIAVFTSLPLYHHGDSVEWAIVTYDTKSKQQKPRSEKGLVAKLYSGNQAIDSMTVDTDLSGRATGKFKLPDDGPSGINYISILHNGSIIGSGMFTVNDYKLPTFTVTVPEVDRHNKPDSLITVTCEANTYSGFPVSGGKVTVRLSSVERRFWFGHNVGNPFWTTDTVIGADGKLALNLSKEILDLSPSVTDIFNVTFDVTSPSGETQSESRIVNIGKPYIISVQNNRCINIDRNLNQLKVSVTDAMNNPESIDLRYRLVTNNDTVTVIPDEKLPSTISTGIYDIIIEPVDPSLAESLTVDNVTLYRSTGKSLPEQLLFVPQKEISTTSNKVEILFGTPRKDLEILMFTVVNGEVKSEDWIKSAGGMETMPIELQPDDKKVQLLFSVVSNSKQATEIIDITRPEDKLEIKVESFRDKVIPNSGEQIKLNLRLNDHATRGSVIMAMQSSALLSLESYDLNIYMPRHYMSNGRIGRFIYGDYSASIFGQIPSFNTTYVVNPTLNLYGYNFSSSYNSLGQLYMRGARMSKSAMTDYAETQVFAAVEESLVALDDGAVTTGETEEADAGGSEQSQTDSFNYRPSEIPLAFFAPMLSTDSTGTVTYSYTVPDANTEWTLNALGYTDNMKVAKLTRTVVASRPIMVQSTLPRYLRYGDNAIVNSTVMNATDSAQTVSTTVTLLNLDMKVLSTENFTDTIASHSSSTIGTVIEAPLQGEGLIYRIKTTNGKYSDGEQSLIPLLPASQPVITSSHFYMQPDSTSMSIEIKPLGKDNSSTLYMYDNPLWEVVSALPSLYNYNDITTYGIVNNLYMAAVAQGILKQQPSIRTGLKAWVESDRSETAMNSLLERNDDLKQLSLQATPWVREAMNDNQRLTALADLLDAKYIDRTIARNIKELKKLAQPDGSLAWCKGYNHSSAWATNLFLEKISSLKQRGYLPANNELQVLINNALSYTDSDVSKQLIKNKNKGDYTNYAYIRSLFKTTLSSSINSRAIQLTINNILRRWEKEGLNSKGIDAIILYNNNYKTMARQVVASIKAFAMTEKIRGTYWHNIDCNQAAQLLLAIETVTPDDTDLISNVAQWLILNKTNQSWGNTTATASTIDVLLKAINVDKASTGSCRAAINGSVINNDTPQIPGMTVSNISASVADKKVNLTLEKNTGLAAFGSIITHRVASMDSIPATSSPSVSINKRYNKVDGTTVVTANELKPGDKVKIQLVIKVNDDLDYVTIIDRRAACLEPVEQISRYSIKDGLSFYQEMTDSETHYYIGRLNRGTYVLDTDMYVVNSGEFSSGVATLQSQLNPGVTANSSTRPIKVSR